MFVTSSEKLCVPLCLYRAVIDTQAARVSLRFADTHMASKAAVLGTLAVAVTLLVSGVACVAQPPPHPDGEASGGSGGAGGVLQLLLARKGDAVRGTDDDSAGRGRRELHSRVSRMDKLAHLSEDEREFMTKQIMQAISGMTFSDVANNMCCSAVVCVCVCVCLSVHCKEVSKVYLYSIFHRQSHKVLHRSKIRPSHGNK